MCYWDSSDVFQPETQKIVKQIIQHFNCCKPHQDYTSEHTWSAISCWQKNANGELQQGVWWCENEEKLRVVWKRSLEVSLTFTVVEVLWVTWLVGRSRPGVVKGNEGAWLVMATLVSLQLLRFSGVEDYHASPCSVSVSTRFWTALWECEMSLCQSFINVWVIRLSV